MARPRGNRHLVLLSVGIDSSNCAVIKRMADELDLLSEWLIRRAGSDLMTRNRVDGHKKAVWLQEKTKKKVQHNDRCG